jgi:LacI family transcriptional regulator
MREVALKAGVSQATVSRVLNGSTSVRDAYRSRVLAAAAELQYRPNRLARNLRRRRADMIGVVVSDIENPHFTEMVRAVEDAAYRKGYRVLLCNTDESAEKQRDYLEVLAQERPLGVILSPTHPAGPEIAELLDEGIPVVAFDRVVDDPRADAVIAGNVAAANRATSHLLGGGHERIGFVAGPPEIETGAERRQGYEEAMRAAGLAPLGADGGFRIDGGRAATARLLGTRPAPTALVVANNLMTIGALKALREAGASVPSDVALVAIDDPFWAELTEPPLTTLAQPVRRMADQAMSLLLGRIGHRRRRSQRVILDFALRVRRSCGRNADPEV